MLWLPVPQHTRYICRQTWCTPKFLLFQEVTYLKGGTIGKAAFHINGHEVIKTAFSELSDNREN